MDQEDIVSLWSKAFYETVLVIAVSYYLWKLNSLNRIIHKVIGDNVDFKSAFDVVSYDNYAPLWYALWALVFVVISVVLAIWFFRAAQYNSFNLQFLLLFGLSSVINVVLIIMIWDFINNPILRAIIIVIIAGTALLASNSSQS
ncbi:hypothetical protein D2U14_11350 [Lacticaseibacillus paracasei]|uniref:hypothetical protein n=1 Tax=Lacticaseibacillus paracasei TaxID=1597 RepID=UPI000E59F4A2|nr:hypothetical protein [Lacticaseibacillus paracasei]RHX72010.1 hypothetical protein D2U14_11350 [Lacticaseibacillus paracasei]